MRHSEPRLTSPTATRTSIRWARVLMAAVLAEVFVILMIGAVIMVHRFWLAPSETAAESRAFGEIAGYYVGPAGGALMTFLAVVWVGRKLRADFVLHGVLIGVVGVLLTTGFIVAAKPEHRLMYVCSYLLRIGAGYLGGLTARARSMRLTSLPVVPA